MLVILHLKFYKSRTVESNIVWTSQTAEKSEKPV